MGQRRQGIRACIQLAAAFRVPTLVTNGVRFALDYDNIQVNHVNAPATDVSASAVAVRSQISF